MEEKEAKQEEKQEAEEKDKQGEEQEEGEEEQEEQEEALELPEFHPPAPPHLLGVQPHVLATVGRVKGYVPAPPAPEAQPLRLIALIGGGQRGRCGR